MSWEAAGGGGPCDSADLSTLCFPRVGEGFFTKVTNSCRWCGKDVLWKAGDRKTKWHYCNDSCRLAFSNSEAARRARENRARSYTHHEKTCSECGGQFRHIREDKVTCSPECAKARKDRGAKRPGDPSPCKWCGVEFIPIFKKWNNYCSKLCRESGKWLAHRERNNLPPYSAVPQSAPVSWSHCTYCDKPFVRRTWRSRCSRECDRKFNLQKAKAEYIPRPYKTEIKKCRECGIEFDAKPRQNTCSQKCSTRHTKRQESRRRRGRYKSAKVPGHRVLGLHELAIRDGFRCHICGDSVSLDVPHLDRTAPTIDHVIPLAKGGLHHNDNLKLAHRCCNSAKSDKLLDRACG